MTLVLIAEADAKWGRHLSELLRSRLGYETEWVRTSKHLIRRLREMHVDLVLMNLQLPGVKGNTLGLVKKLRTTYSPLELPLILLTGPDRGKWVVEGFAAGANDCITLPVQPDIALARIKNQIILKEDGQRLLGKSFPSDYGIEDSAPFNTSSLSSPTKEPKREESRDDPRFPSGGRWDQPIPCEAPLNLFAGDHSFFCKSLWMTPQEMLILCFEEIPARAEYRVQMLDPDGGKLELKVLENKRAPIHDQGAGVLKLNVRLAESSQSYDALCRNLRAAFQKEDQVNLKTIFGNDQDPQKEGNTQLFSSSSLTLNVIKGTRYKFLKYLGKGGFASVYLVEDMALKRPVAMKVLNREYAKYRKARGNFLNEAQIAAQFHHPNIVFVYEVGEIHQTEYETYLNFPAKILKEHPQRLIFFTMQYVEGENLTKWMSRKENQTEEAILDVAIEIAHALAFAHGKGVVHRDIKPDNIMITREGRVVVTDFGIATLARVKADEEAKRGRKLDIACTPYYASPEQLSGETLDARADLYSFGVLLYQLLTGVLPFLGKKLSETVGLHLNAQPPSLVKKRPGIHPDLERLVMKCLRKRPDNRYASAEDLVTALREIKGAGPAENMEATADQLVSQAIVAQDSRQSARILKKMIAFLHLQKTTDNVEHIRLIKTKLADPALLQLLIEKNLNSEHQQLLYEFFMELESSRAVPKLLQSFKAETQSWKKMVLAELAVLAAGVDLMPLVTYGLELDDREACLLLKAFGEIAAQSREPIFEKWSAHEGHRTQMELLKILGIAHRPEREVQRILKRFVEGTFHSDVSVMARKLLTKGQHMAVASGS